MFEWLFYSKEQIIFLWLVFLRICGFLFSAPFLGDRHIPVQIKLLLALFLSWIVFSLIKGINMTGSYYVISGGLMYLSIEEVVKGLLIGFFSGLIFFCFQLAGQIAGYQMGLAIANVFDPNFGGRQSIIGAFMFWVAMMIFFLSDLYLVLIKALANSFFSMPVGIVGIGRIDVMDMMRLVGGLFLVSVQVGIPIILTLLFVMICLGVVTRLMPQMNIFVIGLPIQILVGLLIMIGMLPLLAKISFELLAMYSSYVLKLVARGG